ncbi:hypothetical protein ACROYT_G007545 [Oculina patagonica]
MPKTLARRQATSKPYHVPAVLLARSTVILAFAIFCVSLFTAVEPSAISTGWYRKLIGPGFATNYFKSAEPNTKYSEQNIIDVRAKGFRNLRLRCRADLYSYNYSATNFTLFLKNLTIVVDHCLKHKVIPIISWIHHKAEAYATEKDHDAYVAWWTAVAEELRNKSHKLSFNLFTELGVDDCGQNCGESLRENTDKYNRWTKDVVKAIRDTGGNNLERILILGSPGKTAKDLQDIEESIYSNDSYIMAEWHIYASGPNKKQGGQKYWKGDGVPEGQQNVKNAIEEATNFTKDSGLKTYLGAWMPQDNKGGDLNEDEVINFARFFVTELKSVNIPWSLNVLDRYYDTKEKTWLTEKQEIKGRRLNMSRVLDNIREVMP